MLKVTVVVATYKSSDAGLSRLVSSLDRQTLPADQFEVIFVDDGSPDDTYQRLMEIQRSRPNYRVERRENSGWPSKPRNVGTDLARGEYVAYMDHDDELYPDALRAGYDFAKANNADVLNGKEAYTHTPHWALGTYSADQAQSIGRKDTHPLLPMNPHKLYRKAFLKEHNIRFPEGSKVFWEDVFFNLQVAKHAQVISTMSSTPYYHWVSTRGSGSTLFVKWSDDYWMWFRRVLESTHSQLAGEEHLPQREQLMKHQYVSRILGVFDDGFVNRPVEAREYLFQQCRELQSDFDMERFDSSLSASRRARAELLRRGDRELLEQLCIEDHTFNGDAVASTLEWKDGTLHLHADVRWSDRDGVQLPLARVGEAVHKSLSTDLRENLPAGLTDVTKEITNAKLEFSVRSRDSRIVWLTPSEGRTSVEDVGDGATAMGQLAGVIDPEVAAMGNPLSTGYWDVFVRVRTGSAMTHRALASTAPAAISISRGRLHLAYPNNGGSATIFVDGQAEAVRRLVPRRVLENRGGRITIELAGSHDGSGEVRTRLAVDSKASGTPKFTDIDATIRVDDGVASVSFASSARRVRVRVGDRASNGSEWWTIEGDEVFPFDERPASPARVPSGPFRVLLLTNRDSDNVGDQIIEGSVLALIEAAMANLGLGRLEYRIQSRAAGIISKKYLRTGDPSLLYAARKAISNADLVIFGGAPLFNYKYQNFYLRTIKTLEIANHYGVPVLFSSIGVEAHDAANAKCRELSEALALPCVRQITTRDDFASLQKYVVGTNLPIGHVSDPAVLADMVFGTKQPKTRRSLYRQARSLARRMIRRSTPARAAASRRPVVGLVVTRAGIFRDNGIAFDEKQQRRFWLDVISALGERGYDYKLFTTGHFSDEVFLDAFVKAEGIPASKASVTVMSPEELVRELRACSAVIAYRLHASITAFAYGIPSIGLSWNPKVPQFYDSIGYGQRALSSDRWTAANVVEAIERAMQEGVKKDVGFLMSVYDSLFEGIKSVVSPESDKLPYSYPELRRRVRKYAGTSADQYREKTSRKLRRMYESYQKLSG